jgi:hypothetical protein
MFERPITTAFRLISIESAHNSRINLLEGRAVMRKFVLALVAAGSAIAVAAPASAQYYPQPRGNGYGYNNWGQVRALQARLHAVERQVRFLDRRDVVGERRSDRMREEVDRIEDRLRRVSRNGLNPYEANDISARISRLEQRIQYAAGNRGEYRDRDRDGRNDRYEDDHGRRHDYR